MVSRNITFKSAHLHTLPTYQNFPSCTNPIIKVLGIGGAGCNIVEQLRKHRPGPNVPIYTVNRIEFEREADLKLTSGIDNPLSGSDADLITELVHPANYVFLVAGLGGMTGTALIPHFARIARAHGSKVIAVVGLPFSFEGKRIPKAKSGAAEIAKLADRVTYVDLKSLARQFPPETAFADFMAYANEQALQTIANEISTIYQSNNFKQKEEYQ